ncbi:hypothetical protein ST37_17340 [Vibrio sp. qd031]|uniref:hypothetical protein n=1 Tax=Vibrio sp. qd031 TaxID=1603038 RepID=UPI000A1141A5|nr:hypothetical protein [Vibrio sp. qd031]ORT48534.1 hypothetical protein ST37_17340 [Vibrio sp. qd031]
MKKTLLSVAILSIGFGLVGCNEVDQNGELCRYYVKQDLSTQNFNSALTRLDSQSCQDSYPNGDYMVDQGAAYMGRAGSSLIDIIDATTNENTEGFSSFVSSMQQSKTDTTLVDLQSAAQVFNQYITMHESANVSNTTIDSVRLFNGFTNVVKTSTAIDSLLNGNLDAWIDSDNNPDDKTVDRASCALEYIYQTNSSSSCDDLETTETANISFDDGSSYTLLTVTDPAPSFEFDQYLIGTLADENDSMVMTDGYCFSDYSPAEKGDVTSYPCPVNKGVGDDLNMEEFLVGAINEGFDSILAVVDSSGQDEDGDIRKSIIEFKEEIASGLGENDEITLDHIIQYLNDQ